MPRMEISGRKFGRLTVVSFAFAQKGSTFWNCICDCGNAYITRGGSLTSGVTVSCGCYHRDLHTKHGLSSKKIGPSDVGKSDKCRAYCAYGMMVDRVSAGYKQSYDYHDRGITIEDPRWIDSVVNFVADMGGCPPNMSLDRVDNDKGYSKANCRWATKSEQMTNKRGARVTPELFGKIVRDINAMMRDTHIAAKYNLKRPTISNIRHGRADYCSRHEYIAAI